MRILETSKTASQTSGEHNLPISRIINIWWPLAASWLLMGAEQPAISAVIARLPDYKIHLAAYGGVIFPLALIIESPIIMLLAASTTLSKDWSSYIKIRRFMMAAGASLTILHLLVAFTPLFDLVVVKLLSVPDEIVEPARLGFRIMVPWTWSIAYRRFNQGVLIRFGHSRTISVGTIIRLTADFLVLGVGYALKAPGIVVGTCAVIAGVVSEAVYVGLIVRPVLENELRPAPPVPQPLNLRSFGKFYFPLVLTSLLTLLVQPIGSAALSRMPMDLESLAAWSVVSGLVFMFRSAGIAYNEVVVALLDEPPSSSSLRRFAYLLATGITLAMIALTATPLAGLWFRGISNLDQELAPLAISSMWFAMLLPGLSVLQSWYQGILLHSRRTRPISESVVLFLVVCTLLLSLAVIWGQVVGIYAGWTAFSIATLAQTFWLWVRSQPAMEAVRRQEASLPSSLTDQKTV